MARLLWAYLDAHFLDISLISRNLRQHFEWRKHIFSPLVVARAGPRILQEKHETQGATSLKSLKRYLNEAKQKYGLTRNHELCQKLGVPNNHLSHWYHGVCYPSDEAMVKLARLLKINPLEVIACVNYHKAATSIKRERNPKRNTAQRRFWWQVYNRTVSKR